ncbi:MAG: 4Fe-4S binding protein [Gordonibacter pamelaeae]|nr:4Fe-4S binding protein [Gordonibacter pamelaeae]
MEVDEEGFLYPVIDAIRCIGCGRCLKICTFKLRIKTAIDN